MRLDSAEAETYDNHDDRAWIASAGEKDRFTNELDSARREPRAAFGHRVANADAEIASGESARASSFPYFAKG